MITAKSKTALPLTPTPYTAQPLLLTIFIKLCLQMAPTRGKSNKNPTNKKKIRSSNIMVLRKRNKKNSTNQKTKSGLEGIQRRSTLTTRKRTPQIPNTDSVIFVSETPCCNSKVERKKYKRLRLDSAIFLADPKPAKRVQSHISVITVSSSDEDAAMDRTAEWVAKVTPVGAEEEIFVGDAERFHCMQLPGQVSEAESIREQMRMLHIPPQSFPTVGPSSLESQNSRNGSITNPTVSNSFLSNPPIGLNTSFYLSRNKKSPHTSFSHESYSKEILRKSPKFVFGPMVKLGDFNKPTVENIWLPLEANKYPCGTQTYQAECSSSAILNSPEHTKESSTLPHNLFTSKSPNYQHSFDGGSQDGTSES